MTRVNSGITTYYDRLGLSPAASPQQIRRAYRDLSKLYHPDTTDLAPETAKTEFQVLNEAYATLSNPDRRLAYDHTIGYSRISVIQAPRYLDEVERGGAAKAYRDPSDRPLSSGELFALALLGTTLIGCIIVAIGVSLWRGDAAWQALSELSGRF